MEQSTAKRWRFYSEDEIKGALVYDSEGLFYGEAAGLTLLRTGAFLDVYLKRRMNETVVDVERLAEALAKKGLSVEGSTLSELIVLARETGVEIPLTKASRDISILKARVPVEEVLWIDHKSLQSHGEVVVVLLSTMREAIFRGIKPQPPPKYPDRGEVKGKLMLSLSSGIVGVVGDVVIGAGELGLRIYRATAAKELKWLAFINALKKARLEKIAERLAGEIDPYANPRLSGDEAARALELARKLGGSDVESLLQNYLSESRDVLDVPWSSVVRLGDAVVVK